MVDIRDPKTTGTEVALKRKAGRHCERVLSHLNFLHPIHDEGADVFAPVAMTDHIERPIEPIQMRRENAMSRVAARHHRLGFLIIALNVINRRLEASPRQTFQLPQEIPLWRDSIVSGHRNNIYNLSPLLRNSSSRLAA